MNPRPLDLVLEAVYKQIPEDFDHRLDIRREFDDIIESLRYTAPEAQYLRWEQAVETLVAYVPVGTIWENEIRRIINAEVDYLECLK